MKFSPEEQEEAKNSCCGGCLIGGTFGLGLGLIFLDLAQSAGLSLVCAMIGCVGGAYVAVLAIGNRKS